MIFYKSFVSYYNLMFWGTKGNKLQTLTAGYLRTVGIVQLINLLTRKVHEMVVRVCIWIWKYAPHGSNKEACGGKELNHRHFSTKFWTFFREFVVVDDWWKRCLVIFRRLKNLCLNRFCFLREVIKCLVIFWDIFYFYED